MEQNFNNCELIMCLSRLLAPATPSGLFNQLMLEKAIMKLKYSSKQTSKTHLKTIQTPFDSLLRGPISSL